VNYIGKQADKKTSILVVDDSKVVRLSLTNILGSDYNIIEAEDGMEAWETLYKKPEIDLVLSDLSMPNLDGVGLLKKIRNSDDERVRNIPVIVITGNEEDAKTRTQLLDEGANELITKPFNTPEMIEQARKYTRRQPEATTDSTMQKTDELLNGITGKDHFIQQVRKVLSFAIRNKNELAILMLKLDQFESIKKHYSEPAIEHILITTAEIIRIHTHIEDKLAYFGDGTFAILLPAANAIGTRYLGKRILSDLVAKQFYLGESDATVTVSIGVSAPEIKPGTTYKEILSLAEQRLQAAVNAGGKRIVDKGTATITPVSTLITDDSDEKSAIEKMLKQTEIEMRKLAAQEVEKIKASQSQDRNLPAPTLDIDEINNRLLLIEQENRLLTEELIKLRKNSEDTELLRKQQHETDSLLQQTKLKLQQLQNDYDEMHGRAEEAESSNSRLQETDDDRSIIEQHLLEERSQVQSELNVATQRIEEILADSRKSELIIRNFKQQLITQKNKFELALNEEQKMRSMAEQKLNEIEDKPLDTKKENPFSLTSIPNIAPIEEPQEARPVKPTVESSINSASPAPIIKVTRTAQPALVKKDVKTPKFTWLYKFVVVALIGAIAAAGVQIWLSIKQQQAVTSVSVNQPMTATQQNGIPGPEGEVNNLAGNPYSAESPRTVEDVSSPTPLAEEAKLQAELTIRQVAEEKFQASRRR
jgi:diguanylate cyclase (GGDEF)-like protein